MFENTKQWFIALGLLLVFILVSIGFSIDKGVREKEALKNGREVEAVVVDKEMVQGGSNMLLTSGMPIPLSDDPDTCSIKVYVGKKNHDIDVDDKLYESLQIGDKINVIEYEDKVILKDK